MAVFIQVATEYGALASGNGGSNSFGALERITRVVPVEYVAIGAGALLLLYLIRR